MDRPLASLTQALVRRGVLRARGDAPRVRPAWVADAKWFATVWAAGFLFFLLLLS